MKKYCIGGRETIVHAGAVGYKNNYSNAARANFRSRHSCDTAKPGTARHLACTKLWGGSNKFDTKRANSKNRKS